MFKTKNIFALVLLVSILFLVCPIKMVNAVGMTGPSWSTFGSIDPADIEDDSGEIGFFKIEDPDTWILRIVNNVMGYFFLIGMILTPLIILIGAFMFFTSAGDPARVGKGKALVVWASIGLAILLSGRVIMSILMYILDF